MYHNPYSQAMPNDAVLADQASRQAEGAYFIYTGATSLTAKGVITGNVYRFEKTGSTVEVDRRDASFLTGVPNLRKLPREK
jgi:hypothetical protein